MRDDLFTASTCSNARFIIGLNNLITAIVNILLLIVVASTAYA
jgi:hypothetical protein